MEKTFDVDMWEIHESVGPFSILGRNWYDSFSKNNWFFGVALIFVVFNNEMSF